MYALMILVWHHRKMNMIISNRNNILIQGTKNNSTSQRQCSLKIMPIGSRKWSNDPPVTNKIWASFCSAWIIKAQIEDKKGAQIAHVYCNLKNEKSPRWLELKDANHAKDYIFKRNEISLKWDRCNLHSIGSWQASMKCCWF